MSQGVVRGMWRRFGLESSAICQLLLTFQLHHDPQRLCPLHNPFELTLRQLGGNLYLTGDIAGTFAYFSDAQQAVRLSPHGRRLFVGPTYAGDPHIRAPCCREAPGRHARRVAPFLPCTPMLAIHWSNEQLPDALGQT
jgi:hypothetical protein